MLKAIKKIFGIAEKPAWNWDQAELARVAIGTKIIENGGLTEGGPSTVWTKQPDGTWKNDNQPTLVADGYFNMPFQVVYAPESV